MMQLFMHIISVIKICNNVSLVYLLFSTCYTMNVPNHSNSGGKLTIRIIHMHSEKFVHKLDM